jgi:hypothetical protein
MEGRGDLDSNEREINCFGNDKRQRWKGKKKRLEE